MLYVIIGEKYRVDTADGYQLAAKALSATVLTEYPIIEAPTYLGEPTGDMFDGDLDVKAIALAKALDISPLSNIGYDGRGSGPDVWTIDDAPGVSRA